METMTIHLSQLEKGVVPIIDAVQHDTGRILEMFLTDTVLTSSNTATLWFKRSTGTQDSVNTYVSVAHNSARANITQCLTQSGTTECQLKVIESGNASIVSTYSFKIRVMPNISPVITAEEYWSIQEIAADAAGQVSVIGKLDSANYIPDSTIDSVIADIS